MNYAIKKKIINLLIRFWVLEELLVIRKWLYHQIEVNRQKWEHHRKLGFHQKQVG